MSTQTTGDFDTLCTGDLPTKPWRPQSELEANPIGLPRDVCETLSAQLDRHLASLYTMWHQYRKHHWLVTGPQFMDLHKYLEANYDEIAEDGDLVAERMTAIGGIPTCAPAAQEALSYIDPEPEGMFHIRDSLKRDRESEGIIAINLRKTIQEAGKHGDFGTERILKKVLVHAEDRAHHLDHFLEEDSLEIGRADG
ncbi:MAG: DNA starvation/stationary phase protection protein [Planctomycetota bacterium]